MLSDDRVPGLWPSPFRLLAACAACCKVPGPSSMNNPYDSCATGPTNGSSLWPILFRSDPSSNTKREEKRRTITSHSLWPILFRSDPSSNTKRGEKRRTTTSHMATKSRAFYVRRRLLPMWTTMSSLLHVEVVCTSDAYTCYSDTT